MAPSTSAPWADTPFDVVPSPRYTDKKADPKAIFTANEMAVSHNIYIRGLNAIYNQAEQVTTVPDIRDFLTFCQIWIEVIHHHHSLEEEIMFPGIEQDLGKEGIMQENLEQHHQFESAMQEFKGYVERVGKVGEGYEATVLKALVDKFGTLLVRHLHEEITSLLQIGKEFDTSAEVLKKNYLAFEKELVATSSWTRHHPFIFGCRDATFEDGVNGNWPADVPFFIPYVISGVLSRKVGAGVWRFLPSDFHGKPRALPFAKS
ncbi:hemerythrin HHE cation binding domain-containing protein [Aspergillus pseudoustus]|uniref:Hemerythrin HHE cation binding domain-containing protein n=1 Tax=Aspergillus pseudoustus TaxID=1810923 RepID=A0ABR4KFJ2_9EURO